MSKSERTAAIADPPDRPGIRDVLDEEALIKEARERARRRRFLRLTFAIVLIALVCLTVAGFRSFGASPAKTSSAASAKTLACPGARVKLLSVSSIPGAAFYAGLLVQVSETSSSSCSVSGYPSVVAELSNRATAIAGHARSGYLPGGISRATGSLPRLALTSRPRVMSFTIQWVTGNGPTCPSISAIQIKLPGSPDTLTARSMSEQGAGVVKGDMGIECGRLQVRPLVDGSSGKAA